jgi:histidine triad (HIT) family protein
LKKYRFNCHLHFFRALRETGGFFFAPGLSLGQNKISLQKNLMSIFTKIISGEIPSYKIAEDEKFIAFLDVFPLVKGHVLVVPKIEVDKLFDLPSEYLSAMLSFAQPIAKAIEKSFDCKRCGISVVGLEVPHAHMHLVPINTANDLNFTQAKIKVEKEEMEKIKQIIVSNI